MLLQVSPNALKASRVGYWSFGDATASFDVGGPPFHGRITPPAEGVTSRIPRLAARARMRSCPSGEIVDDFFEFAALVDTLFGSDMVVFLLRREHAGAERKKPGVRVPQPGRYGQVAV